MTHKKQTQTTIMLKLRDARKHANSTFKRNGLLLSEFSKKSTSMLKANMKPHSAMIGKATLSTSVTLFALVFFLPLTSSSTANAPTGDMVTAQQQPQTLKINQEVSGQAIVRDTYTITDPPPQTTTASYSSTALTFTNNTEAAIQWPFRVGVPLSDGFGGRVAPCETCSTQHNGQDFIPGEGSQIQAIADGTVIAVVNSAGNSVEAHSGSYGTYVIIEHNIDGQLVTSTYAHMEYQSSPLVVGQQVKATNLVGTVGNTGQSTGAHLHLEIRVNGSPVNPILWLTSHNR
jgi:murein DD-endopeptidase MepM/ murein hydrolase activator NlpD